MSEYQDNHFAEAHEPSEAPPAPRSWAWLAWCIILLIVAGSLIARELTVEAAPQAGDDKLSRRLIELQYRTLVGAAKVLKEQAQQQVEPPLPAPIGTVEQRLYHVVLTGELAGPKEALLELDRLAQDMQKYKPATTPEQDRLRDILRRLYDDYARGRLERPSLTPADRALLRGQLGWFGELALAPAGSPPDGETALAAGAAVAAGIASNRAAVLAPAEEAFSLFAGAIGLIVLFGLAGLIGLIVFLAMAASGKIVGRIECGSGRGGVYAETFALWLLLWFGLSFLAAVATGGDLFLASGASLLSLIALAWPVQRGIPWTQVRRDIGLTTGQDPLFEPVAGVMCYIMALPLLAIGLVIMLVLLYFQRGGPADGNPFTAPGMPSHPIIEPLVFGGWQTRAVIVLLAAVVAPVVEEIMFRGVLYRHLREASCAWAKGLSIVFSGTVASALFAVLHPQGLIAVPVLMALAYGFTIAREWRGTLVPCMIGHGISNGLVTLLVLAAVGD